MSPARNYSQCLPLEAVVPHPISWQELSHCCSGSARTSACNHCPQGTRLSDTATILVPSRAWSTILETLGKKLGWKQCWIKTALQKISLFKSAKPKGFKHVPPPASHCLSHCQIQGALGWKEQPIVVQTTALCRPGPDRTRSMKWVVSWVEIMGAP